MSVLIRGMKMPDYGYVCLKVFANGEVLMTKEVRGSLVITGIRDKVGTAVPVPPHGRLGDLDALLKKCEFVCTDDDEDTRAVRYSIIEDAPTIIPASGENEDG